MALHAKRQRLDAGQDQERVERRQRRPDVAQAQHPAGDGEGEIAEGLVQHDAVVFGPRLAQHRIAVLARPVERAGVDDHAADRVAVAAEEFRQRMNDDVGAVVDRLAEVGRRQRVVDDQRHAGAAGDVGDRLDVGDDAAGIGDQLDEDRLGLRRHRALERRDVVGVGPRHVPAEILERVIELVDRAAIELARGDELVAGLHQAVEHQHLRGVAGGDREPRGAAFERGDALLQHGVGRIADAGVDVAEGLQAEQRGRVIDVVEHERRGLIDRGRARAGGRIGLRAGMDRKRGKAGSAFGHGALLWCGRLWCIEPQGSVKAKGGGCVNSQPPSSNRGITREIRSTGRRRSGSIARR